MDNKELLRALEGASERWEPGIRVIGFHAIASLADRFGLSRHEAELTALSAEIVPERYLRNMYSLSAGGQKRLLESTVVLVGLGGLGGHLLDQFSRAGVGCIRAFDGDGFDPTNLNRQLLSREAKVDKPKAEAALEHAMSINSATRLDIREMFLDKDTLREILQGADLLVDALGALDDRAILASAAAQAEVPLVTAAVAGWTAWLSTVFPGDPDPSELLRSTGSGDDAQHTLGVPTPAVTALAGIQAAEAIRLLAGEEPCLRRKMLVMDLSSMSFETMSL